MCGMSFPTRGSHNTLYLSQFNFALKHVPEKNMGKADRLSRRPDWQEGVEKDNEDQKLIKPKWIREVETIIEERNLKERIRRGQKGSKGSRRAKEGRNKDVKK